MPRKTRAERAPVGRPDPQELPVTAEAEVHEVDGSQDVDAEVQVGAPVGGDPHREGERGAVADARVGVVEGGAQRVDQEAGREQPERFEGGLGFGGPLRAEAAGVPRGAQPLAGAEGPGSQADDRGQDREREEAAGAPGRRGVAHEDLGGAAR
jgi:hypothetical protein